MRDKGEYSVKETQRVEKLEAEEASQLAKDDVRKRVYFAKEQNIEKGQKDNEAKQAEKRASENIKDLAREKVRKETYLAQEKKIADGQDARRLKDKNQSLK